MLLIEIFKNVIIYESPSELSTVNTPNSQIYINFRRGDFVKILKRSLLRLNDVLHAATNNRYIDGDDI